MGGLVSGFCALFIDIVIVYTMKLKQTGKMLFICGFQVFQLVFMLQSAQYVTVGDACMYV